MPFHPKFLATAIGSMPHTDVERALDVVLASLPHAPIWPQFPRISLSEQMEPQFCEGMPRAVIDRERQRLYFDTTGDPSEDLAAFYEVYLAAMDPDEGTGDCSALAIGPEHARGFYGFLSRLEARVADGEPPLPWVKVQVTGPVSFALTSVDQDKRAIYYNEEFRDMVVKALAMKCRWQLQRFKPFAHGQICFIDEPILSAFGSSTYVSVTREDVVALVNELVEAIHAEGALAGIHCCGNTEWSICVDAGVDIVNFDAFGYGETIAMYPEAVNELFARDGALAWGLVPSSPKVRDASVQDLTALFGRLVDTLAARGVDRSRILEQAMVTSSCGTGSMAVADAELVFTRIGELAQLLAKQYGFEPA